MYHTEYHQQLNNSITFKLCLSFVANWYFSQNNSCDTSEILKSLLTRLFYKTRKINNLLASLLVMLGDNEDHDGDSDYNYDDREFFALWQLALHHLLMTRVS